VNAGVFHSENDLEDQAAPGNDLQKVRHAGVSEVEGLVARIDAKAGHLEYFVAAANVLLPVGPGEVDGAEGHQEAAAVFAAGAGETFVDAVDVFGEEGFEAAGPGLGDAMFPEFFYEGGGVAIFESAKRPIEKGDVGIDDSDRGS
jgi:hypothetical protein